MKACFKCEEVKDLSEFYAHKRMRDGHFNKCKQCAKSDAKKYSSTAAGKATSARSQRTQRARYPEKRKAGRAAYKAKRKGLLIAEPCRDCGEAEVDMHHPDYSRPLDVVWLCKPCHRKEHQEKAA